MLKFLVFAAAAGSGTGIYLTHTHSSASQETIEIIPTGTATNTYKEKERQEIIKKVKKQAKEIAGNLKSAERTAKSAHDLMKKAESTLINKQNELNAEKTSLNTTSTELKGLYAELKTIDASFIEEVKTNMDKKLKISHETQMKDFYTKQKTSYEKELSLIITNIKLFCEDPSSPPAPKLAENYNNCKDAANQPPSSTSLKSKGTEMEKKITSNQQELDKYSSIETYTEETAKKESRESKLQAISSKTITHNNQIRSISTKEKLVQLAINNLNRAHINYASSKHQEEQARIKDKEIKEKLEEVSKTEE